MQNDSLYNHPKKYLDKLKKLTLMSDIIARNVLKDKTCCEYILQIIMNDPQLTLSEIVIQADYKNLYGRSVELDCFAKSTNEEHFNIEIEQEEKRATPQRARYHLGLMDMNILEPGEDFTKLPQTYVIFICRGDALGCGLPLARINRRIDTNNEQDIPFPDKAQIIYIDSSKNDGGALGRLMQDFHAKDSKDMHPSILAKKMHELKETEKGVALMCNEMREIYEEGRIEGIEEGKMKEKVDIAKNLLQQLSLPLEQVLRIVNVDGEARNYIISQLQK